MRRSKEEIIKHIDAWLVGQKTNDTEKYIIREVYDEVKDDIFADIIKILNEFGNKWEVSEESGEVSGEFEYKQFKETSLFKHLKKLLNNNMKGKFLNRENSEVKEKKDAKK